MNQVTKCTFHKYGPSGTVENKDGLCVLALNVINEKIYIFLWFYFIILSVWTAIHLMFRIASIASRSVSKVFALIPLRSPCSYSTYRGSRYLLFCNRVRSVNRSDVSTVLRRCQYGNNMLRVRDIYFWEDILRKNCEGLGKCARIANKREGDGFSTSDEC